VFALALLLALPGHAACPSTQADLSAEIDAGVTAYKSWAWDRFGLARSAVAEMLPCLDGPLSPATARQVHLFTALQAGVDKDEARAAAAFRALLDDQPAFALPEDLAAPGSLLRRAFDAAKTEKPGEVQPLAGRGWVVDGAPKAHEMPLYRPTLVQRQAEGLTQTWLVSGPPLPDDLQQALSRKSANQAGEGRALPLGLGVASGSALLLSAASLAVAWQSWRDYPDAKTTAEADTLNTRNHAFLIGGAAGGAVGIGLGVGAAITLVIR